MVKNKTKKRTNKCDDIHSKAKKRTSAKSLNPFEIHINNEKMTILGRKSKNDRGVPGVSRARAIKKRKETLLQEYKIQNKSNQFNDKRIGERNVRMTEDDRIMARFAALRKKAHTRKSIFNLADDEVLTHKGQTLSEIERFDDPRSDNDNSDDDDRTPRNGGKLEASFVKDAHFGGGILKRTGREGALTHKELIEQLIVESKKRKAEKQQTKEATLELTEKLDSEWKDLLPLVNNSKKTKDDIEIKSKLDDYDKTVRELKFEARGTVSDRLKTENEIAQEEKEKLEKLEEERLQRMNGLINEQNSKGKHRSADDLDDDLVYESDPEYLLSYNEQGESNVTVDAQINGKSLNENIDLPEEEEEEEERKDNKRHDKNEAEEEEEQDEEVKADEEEEEEEEQDKTVKANEEVEEVDEDCSEDDLSDLKADESSDEESDDAKEAIPLPVENDNVQTKIISDLLERKVMMEKAQSELPYTFELPQDYDTLQKLLENQSSIHQGVIIERMLKCNHPSLGKANTKENLNMLLAYLFQFLNDLASEASDCESITACFASFNALVPQIYDLAHLHPENAHNSVKEVIKEKHEEYRKKAKIYPSLEVLLFLKLVSVLFSTSDFRHQIVTPCFVFIEQILTKCKIRNRKDISFGLFLITIILEFTTLSKRYSPAVINYLGGLLHMSIPKSGVKLIKVIPPFKPTFSHLVLVNRFNSNIESLKMQVTDLILDTDDNIDEIFKIRAFNTTLLLIQEFNNNFENLSSNVEIFSSIRNYLQLIPMENYPDSVQNQYQTLCKQLDDIKSKRLLNYLVTEAKKPKALRLYEPKIEEIFDGKRRKIQSRDKAEREKLLYKLKKEQKGALREIRRDKSFLGRIKIRQEIRSDNERKEKVKRIYAEASMQQSELNSLDRKNKRK